MPDDLDPTTARLVSELASSMLPSLTKSLSASIPTGEFVSAIERSSRAGNDLRTQIERAIRSSIDDSRAARSVMMQSIGTLSDEISALRKAITSMPDNLERKLQNNNAAQNQNQNQNQEKNNDGNNYDEIFAENNTKLNEIRELLGELIKGIQQFSETYAKESRKLDSVNVNVNPNSDSPEAMHNSELLDKLLNETLPSLEGLIRAQAKSQTNELHEFSREINAMNEQNNTALLHEVHEAIETEIQNHGANNADETQNAKMKKLLMINMCLSGACVFMSVIMFFMLMFR